jgi:uncharacterized protein
VANHSGFKQSRFNLCCEYQKHPGYLVLYNTFSSACILLHRTQYRNLIEITKLSRRAHQDDENSDLNEWLRMGFIVNSDVDEIGNLRYFTNTRRYSDRASSLTLTLAPTMLCNMECVYCFEGDERECRGKMQEDTMFNLWRFVENGVRKSGILSICWYGGEPLLAFDEIIRFSRTLLKIVERRRLQYTANIITNGTLMTLDSARALRNAGVNLAQITLDGPKEIHDRRRPTKGGSQSFEAVIQGIRNASKYLKVHVRVNLDRQNVASFSSFVEYLHESGIIDFERVSIYPGYTRYFSSNPSNAAGSHRSYARKWMLSNKQFGEECLGLEKLVSSKTGRRTSGLSLPKTINVCGALCLNSFLIRGDGEVFKCWGECSDSKYSCGNLNKGLDLFSLNTTRWLALDLFDNKHCLACALLPVCMGGCAYTILNRYPMKERCSPFKYTYPKVLNEFVETRVREESEKAGTRPALFFGQRQL